MAATSSSVNLPLPFSALAPFLRSSRACDASATGRCCQVHRPEATLEFTLVRLCTLKGDGAELQNETRTLRSLSSFSLVITTLEASMPTFTVAPAHEQRQGQHSQLTKQA